MMVTPFVGIAALVVTRVVITALVMSRLARRGLAWRRITPSRRRRLAALMRGRREDSVGGVDPRWRPTGIATGGPAGKTTLSVAGAARAAHSRITRGRPARLNLSGQRLSGRRSSNAWAAGIVRRRAGRRCTCKRDRRHHECRCDCQHQYTQRPRNDFLDLHELSPLKDEIDPPRQPYHRVDNQRLDSANLHRVITYISGR